MKVRHLPPVRRALESETAIATRLKPRHGLGVQRLRRRLYQAGCRKADVGAIAHAILAGPGGEGLPLGGVFVLGWPKNALAARFGKRVARAATRFVMHHVLVRDEFWDPAGDQVIRDFARRMYQVWPPRTFEVRQDLAQLGLTPQDLGQVAVA